MGAATLAGGLMSALSKSGQMAPTPGSTGGGGKPQFSVPENLFGGEGNQSAGGAKLSTSLLGGQQPVMQAQAPAQSISPIAQMQMQQQAGQLGKGK